MLRIKVYNLISTWKTWKTLVLALVLLGVGGLISNHTDAGFDDAKSDAKKFMDMNIGSNPMGFEAYDDIASQAATGEELEAAKALKNEGLNIENISHERLEQSEIGSDFMEHSNTRDRFTFDPENDPMFINASKADENHDFFTDRPLSEYEDCSIEEVEVAPQPEAIVQCTEWAKASSGACTSQQLEVNCYSKVEAADLKNLRGSGVSYNKNRAELHLGKHSYGSLRGSHTIFTSEAIFEIEDKESINQFNLVYLYYDDIARVTVNGVQVYHSYGSSANTLQKGVSVCMYEGGPNSIVGTIVDSSFSGCYTDRKNLGKFITGDKKTYTYNMNTDIRPHLKNGTNSVKIETSVINGGSQYARFIAKQNNTYCDKNWAVSSACNEFQQFAQGGFCTDSNPPEICVEGPEIREFNGIEVYSDCWRYEKTYTCNIGDTNAAECDSLRAKGCSQIGSECTETFNGVCLEREQTMSCPYGESTKKEIMNCGGPANAFCVDGNCADTSYEPSTDLALAATWMNMLGELGKDFDPDTMEVFKGKNLQCNSEPHRDCCPSVTHRYNPETGEYEEIQSGAGGRWCNDDDEKILEEKFHAGMCSYMGNWCSSKSMGVCWRKKKSYCCFTSMLGRILQEQGRPQLNRDWGDKKNPNCSGFTVDELELLDWSKIDLSEFFKKAMGDMNLSADGTDKIPYLEQRILEMMQGK